MLATLNEVHGNQWNRIEHFLAVIADSLAVAGHYALVGPHVDPKKLRSVKPPKPMLRPGQRRKRRKATPEELRELFRGS
jgi:hypothetical protein